ncbi:hypothetical protein SAMN05216304_102736 [Bosea sp. OK403]|uniref:hypothetical protein n=1 Tax=Bosea sp. OK403 TaxID=1855286 RepID=UPI0008EC2B94|nr:hypothetical protein [Bosea sp. OK403]SFI43451.1 hypothetical protein SAMN05216304_102736 [Bosea sp. OK403]
MTTHMIVATATSLPAGESAFTRKLFAFQAARIHYGATVRLTIEAAGYDGMEAAVAESAASCLRLRSAMTDLADSHPSSLAELANYARHVSQHFDSELGFDPDSELWDEEIALLRALPRSVSRLID